MPGATITVDVRERALMQQLDLLCVKHVSESMNLGDVLIALPDGGKRLLLERKTLADLSSSVSDGRFKEQRGRWEQSHTEEDANEQLIYVLEHATVPGATDTVGRGVPMRNLHAALTKLQLRDGYHVLFTRDATHTAELVKYLAKQLGEGGLEPKPLAAALQYQPVGGGAGKKRKRVALMDNHTATLAHMLSGIPGMSHKRAETIVYKFPTLTALCAATEADLCKVEGVGKGLASRILNLV